MNTLAPIESMRRALRRDYPELYAYVTSYEVARALDQAGELASGAASGTAAANRVWHYMSTVDNAKRTLLAASLDEPERVGRRHGTR